MIRATWTRNLDSVVVASQDCADDTAADAYLAGVLSDNGWSADDYTSAKVDVSALYSEQDKIAQGLRAQLVGAQVLAKVRSLNIDKALSDSDIANVLSDSAISTIQRLLQVGALAMAKTQINALTPLPYLGFYTADDIAALVAIIDNSGLAS